MRLWVLSLTLLVLLSCGDAALCENSSQVEIPSPDAELAAWVFIRGCGATTSSSAHVSILPADSSPPAEAGNTFIIEPILEVSVEWSGEHQVLISHSAGAEIFKQEYQVAGVTVSYEAK